ncbi:MAG: hypothetical protein J6B68_01775 [Lachnospiraceae bacterium]|nr:hypothetical protein [Lachnospiraceae bacterium]MBP3477576.1 hypothetical protein [Lachnospiraceae bacterium]
MRLIDADEFKRKLAAISNELSKSATKANALIDLIDLIDIQPTEYDVDKVVEQLKDRENYLLKEFVFAEKAEEVKEKTLDRINEIDGIIEIVKAGGVNE